MDLRKSVVQPPTHSRANSEVRSGYSELCSVGYKPPHTPQKWRPHSLSKPPVPLTGCPCGENVTFYIQPSLHPPLVSVYAHCPYPSHHAQLWRDWLHLLTSVWTLGAVISPLFSGGPWNCPCSRLDRAGAPQSRSLTVLGALCSACRDLSVVLGSQFCNPRGLYDFQAVIFFFFPQAKATSVFVWNSNKTSTLWQLDLTMWKEPQLTADRMTENWAKGDFFFFLLVTPLCILFICSGLVSAFLRL